MEYNNPSEIVKDLSFGTDGKDKIMHGVDKLANAVKSTLGASGKCVIYEDALGRPVITKDGVTVAKSISLDDPVEDLAVRVVREACEKTALSAGTLKSRKQRTKAQSSDKVRTMEFFKNYTFIS